MTCNEIVWYSMMYKLNLTAWDSMGENETAWCNNRQHGTALDSMGQQETAWDSITQHKTVLDSMGQHYKA